MFEIEGLDHVALAVRDVQLSAAWYQDVLGLERWHENVWGDMPALVGKGTSGLALFPVHGDAPKPRPGRDVLAMRHFAFRVSRPQFGLAQEELAARGIPFTFQDHDIAHSIYLNDPDGHEIELTTYL